MKAPRPLPRSLLRSGLIVAVVATTAALIAQFGSAIPLTGANGRTVDFAGIKSAGPKGLTIQVKPDDPTIEVGWEKFDLQKVAAQFPEIGEAYKRALVGEITELNLGTFAPKKTVMPAVPAVPPEPAKEESSRLAKRGVFKVKVQGGPDAGFETASFMVSLPGAGEPKGILLLSIGADGNSIRYFPRLGFQNAGQWAPYQKDLGFAILAYEFFGPMNLYEVAPFVFAEKGSGEALLSALDELGEKSGKSLSDLPIAIYGSDILGSAFAFNFAQWKPERVIAAVAGKGAFYSTPPSQESVKVPVLLIWGEYDQEPKLWKATHTHSEILEKHANLNPNWVNAKEPRSGSGLTPESEILTEAFLKKMIAARMQEEGLVDLGRSEAWVGNLKARSVGKLEDPEAELPAGKTWLPDQEFAEMWEKFINRKLALPEEPAP